MWTFISIVALIVLVVIMLSPFYANRPTLAEQATDNDEQAGYLTKIRNEKLSK